MCMSPLQAASRILDICQDLLRETLRFLRLMINSKASLAAEVLFLRKQLAFYQERNIKPHRFNDAARLSMLVFGETVRLEKRSGECKPETFTGWHRQAFRLFWRWKSRGGRPRLPKDIRRLIVEMAVNNPTWGQGRVADELSLKLGILVSPRTVRNHWPHDQDTEPKRVSTQRWRTFVRNHANSLIACDFATVVTAHFRVLYVFVLMEVGMREILHYNVTSHSTAPWTTQQFREELVASYLYQVHLYHWLETNDYGRFLADNDL